MRVKKQIQTDKEGRNFFTFNQEKHYLSNIDQHGHDLTCFTNAGYFAGFKLIDIEHNINDHVILKVL